MSFSLFLTYYTSLLFSSTPFLLFDLMFLILFCVLGFLFIRIPSLLVPPPAFFVSLIFTLPLTFLQFYCLYYFDFISALSFSLYS